MFARENLWNSLHSSKRRERLNYGEQKQARIWKNNLSVLSPSTQGIKFLAKLLRSSTEAWIGQAPTNKSF
ncbi:transcriptional regulator [Escherichia coli]|nr:transcriptional regulator [Escherichia coli]RBX97549.1 transcriptional regulator [Escherichia coli]RCY00031.1 transcriptional regulator [Escherichia coli]RCY12298.1 transcriptional regulator [Escherichia coli]RCY34207.1 transcriptional regulator [Escherichia coli]